MKALEGHSRRYRKHEAAGQMVTAALFGFAKGNIEKAGGLFSSPDALRNDVGKAVAKKFPYKKQG